MFPKTHSTVFVLVGNKRFCIKPYSSFHDQKQELLNELETSSNKLVSVIPSMYLFDEVDPQQEVDIKTLYQFLSAQYPNHYHGQFFKS